nr:MAG TPA: hypothetical protein [Caudoviricetes sp.]
MNFLDLEATLNYLGKRSDKLFITSLNYKDFR